MKIGSEYDITLARYKIISKQIKNKKDITNLSMNNNQGYSMGITRNNKKNISTIFNPYQIYNSARNKNKNIYSLSSTEDYNSNYVNTSSEKVMFPHIYGNNSFQTQTTTKQKFLTPKSHGTHTISYDIPIENKKVLSNKDVSHYNKKIKNNNIPLYNNTIKKSSIISLRLPPKKKITLLKHKNNSTNETSNTNTNTNHNPVPKTIDNKIEINCKNIEDIKEPSHEPPLHIPLNENLIFMTKHKPTHYIQSKPGIDHYGKTKKNQDTFIYLENIFNIENFDMFGVLDGHGKHGHNVSSFVSNRITSYFTNLSTYTTSTSVTLPLITSLFTDQNYSLLHSFYMQTESQLPNQHFDVNFSGTTCVIVFRLSTKLIISNIGDSRAILIRKCIHNTNVEYVVECLSEDHKPGVHKEKKRIELKGGVVKCCDEDINVEKPILRVWIKGEKYPGIAISRTLGDEIAKTIGVIYTPEIKEMDLKGDECCIIVASDGVWEFLTNEKVKDIVLPFYIRNDPKGAVNSIISIASIEWDKDGSARDDITCIAYFFQHKEHEIQLQKHNYYQYNNMYYYNNTYW